MDSNPVDSLCLVTNTKQIHRIPQVIAVSGGIENAYAILAALRENWITDPGNRRRLCTRHWAGGEISPFPRV
ncbi:MAG: hypothetical protein JO077_02165 [Verrucomicrobia bacterium]|nr:hypothetical protein [Verrucomicrobiota bacterium]